MYHFIFPADPLNTKQVDDIFLPEAEFCKKLGFSCSVFDGEKLFLSKKIGENIKHSIYRGWMLNEDEYKTLEELTDKENIPLLTNIDNYYQSHHLHNYYKNIEGYTPKTLFSEPNTESIQETYNINNIGNKRVFIKDSVKSLTDKPNGESSISNSIEETINIFKKIKEHRGKVEGKICIRDYMKFIGKEERYMVFQGKVFSNEKENIPECVKYAAKNHKVPFFSVDVNIDENHNHWIVEIGDGQVSDFYDKGWSVENIYQFLVD